MLGVIVDKTKRRAMVILKNFRCRWGQCTFCPFYLEMGTDLNDVFETNIRILQFLEKALYDFSIEQITIFNGGSFELPLEIVLQLAKFTENRVVDIEMRPEYVTP